MNAYANLLPFVDGMLFRCSFNLNGKIFSSPVEQEEQPRNCRRNKANDKYACDKCHCNRNEQVDDRSI